MYSLVRCARSVIHACTQGKNLGCGVTNSPQSAAIIGIRVEMLYYVDYVDLSKTTEATRIASASSGPKLAMTS